MDLIEEMKWWCRGRWWLVRLPVVLLYVWLIYMYSTDMLFTGGLIDGVNFMIHEAGHVVFMPGGQVMHVLGGTLLQLLIPVLFGIYFLFQRDYFAITFTLAWLSTNLFDVATYLGDASEMNLPLLFDWMIHDWNYLLSHWGLIAYDDLIARWIRRMGWVSLYGATIWSGVLLWWMATLKRVEVISKTSNQKLVSQGWKRRL